MADEGDFLELLIASERVLSWKDALQTRGLSAKRKKEIIMEMQRCCDAKSSYAEEACRAGMVHVLTGILSTTADEDVMEAISAIMSACSGPMASGGKVADYKYGGQVVRVREGALGDGLGAKVWTVAHILCKELSDNQQFIHGHKVLEIGAGCGICGILAAKLGATEVVLTDVEGPVLRNLRECMHLNNKPDSQAGCAASQPLGGSLLVDDGELFDDADSVDDLDFGELLSIQDNGDSAGLGQAAGAAGAVCTQGCGAWEAGTMMVRTLDWLESLQRMGPSKGCEGKSSAPEALDAKTFYANDLLRMDAECTLSGEMPPGTDMDEQFEVIIGTDIMYEPVHARLVAAVLAHRLAAGGAALMVCAVRQARTFAAFAKECAGRGLRYRTCQVYPIKEYEGIMGREEDYEGGFLLMAVDHMSSPSTLWHRDDFSAPTIGMPNKV